ncbi:MAG: DUF1015 domain-containing protein [Bacteroidetes bacterium]|nr:DUF1015 domain-containing protein [Bacteroidota bacterium]
MAKLAPFKAIRPVRDKVHLVATRPYYSYKKNVLKAKLEDNPFTFLRIINPEFNNEVKTKPNSDERFQLVKSKYNEFIDAGILIQDESPRLYIYRQTDNGHAYTGIVAGASIEEYRNDLIKKHEATLTSREAMFTRYLDIVGYNAEPVLLSYQGGQQIEELLNQFTSVRPEYEFTTTDRITHELWVLSENDTLILQNAFEDVEATYIADGHHRSASSARLFTERLNSGKTVNGNVSSFLAFFVEESRLKILEFNRLVKTLNGYSSETFLYALRALGQVKEIPKAEKPQEEHQIHLCVKSKWYEFTIDSYLIDKDHPVKSLDSDLLTELILKPLLGIEDLKTSDQIEFLPGNESFSSIEEKIDSGKFEIGFVLFPATIDQVKRVADNQMNMPPKSTWVEPKLRSGLTIYNINE